MSCSKKLKNGELLELAAWGRAELLRAGIEEAQEECERVWMKILGCARSGLYLKEREEVALEAQEQFLTLIGKRAQRIPLAYLLKEADFWQETLYVDERCLIPRPETEILVEQVLKWLEGKSGQKISFLDIGTGSGAIAIAILHACKNAWGTLLDVSEAALGVTHENLARYALQDRAKMVQGDLFEPFPKDKKWDVIVSNPPYLSEEDWKKVQEELKFEPQGALDGGKDGLDFYRKIIAGAKDHLISKGLLALEVGQSQADKVSTWLHDAGYDNIQRFKDYLGIERVVIAKKGGI